MSIALGAVFALHVVLQGQQPPRRQPTVVRDSTPADSILPRSPRRLPVTDEHRRTAFRDDRTRDLVASARRARLRQDSSLTSYDATVRQRMTARMEIGKRGPERVMYRQESAFHVQWALDVGARVELTGARVGIPVAPEDAERESLASSLTSSGMTPIPYFPGQESMGLGMLPARAEVDDRGVAQPLAEGAEAYYTYSLGDSMTWTLPGGKIVRLRELSVRPRSAQPNVVVGSLWFDVESTQLVRAAYRLAVPRDMWVTIDQRHRERGERDNPLLMKLAKAIVSPFRVEVSAVTIEYGLFDGRFWLPRTRSLQGSQQVSFARMPVELEQAFTYATINKPLPLSAVVINEPDRNPLVDPDSLRGEALQKWRDSAIAARIKTRRAFADSLRAAPCDSTGYRVLGRLRTDLPVAVKYPCDVAKLTTSEDFTKPLYDPNEELFGTKQRDALLDDALPFGAQALIRLGAMPKPTFQYGLSMTRYNRIEGLSTGVFVEQQLGAGYVVGVTGRFGFADREPNGELAVGRTNSRNSLSLGGYNRLVSAGDWGNPLSFGSSMSALLFGRDDGFYYRASGAELRWTSERGAKLEWRLFGEQQRPATQRTNYSVGGAFTPNIVATTGATAGASVRLLHSHGLDPRGFRSFTDFRAEAAGGDSVYGRGALDVTLSTGLPKSLAAALTLAGGTSVGHVPPQRRWYLGGTQTIRGQSPDTVQNGNAFWMTRAEFGRGFAGYRMMLFGDLGWVGDRSALTFARPMSAAGIGTSMFDGMLRFDVARGFYPRRQTRVAAYLRASS